MLNGSHGGNDLALDVELDLSANLNPLGMPENVREAVIASAGECENYPDPFCRELRRRLAEHTGVSAENIVCGNGADDLIYRIAGGLKLRRVLICAPAFGEYRKAFEENGCHVSEYILDEKKDFALGEEIFPEISKADMIIAAAPNNPSGQVIDPSMVRKIAESCMKNGTFFLCDESFMGFVREGNELTALNVLNDKVIVLRSFTKLFAMAGLRLGYAVFGSREAAEKTACAGQYWSVSAPAQAAGIAALGENGYTERSIISICKERSFLSEELTAMGLKVYPSYANFILFRAPETLGELLLKEKILIRCCGDYSGLDGGFFRVAVRSREENQRFAAEVRRVLNG